MEIRPSVGPPGGGNSSGAAAHGGFKLFLSDIFVEELSELNCKVAMHKVDVGKAELQLNVIVLLNQVLDGEEDRLKAIFNYLLAHVAGLGNGHRVRVNHAEALLENRALGLGGVDLLLALVADEVALQVRINDEAGSIGSY